MQSISFCLTKTRSGRALRGVVLEWAGNKPSGSQRRGTVVNKWGKLQRLRRFVAATPDAVVFKTYQNIGH